MYNDIPPQAPDSYRIRLPYAGWVTSPLPLNVWILIGLCSALLLYGFVVFCQHQL